MPFKKGTSGNPIGRPKGSVSTKAHKRAYKPSYWRKQDNGDAR